MTTELTMLAWAVLLLIVLVAIQAAAGARSQGFLALAGSRDHLPPPGIFQSRTKRVVDNHREGLTIFAPLILIAAVAHISNHWTVLGAEIFLIARVIHAILYLAGVPLIRPLAFGAGLIGTLMVLAAVLGLG
ncbi:MAG: MAPEG family protein [Caulobacteraceae bacterium]